MRNSFTFELQGNLHMGGVRPFFWQLAAEAGLDGWVANSATGILLHLDGDMEQIGDFVRSLPRKAPGAFQLKGIKILRQDDRLMQDREEVGGFHIVGDNPPVSVIVPDRAPCEKCIAEIFDQSARRYAYPFSSCAICGPGFSYAFRSPLIRKNSSLRAFPMCADCKRDTEFPETSHLHGSETLTCPRCGPQFFLIDGAGELLSDTVPFTLARKTILQGQILAMQSLYGGFQLYVNAFDEKAVRELRLKRSLPVRPLALVARNLEVVRRYCRITEAQERLLKSPVAPMLILPGKDPAPEVTPIPKAVYPDTDTLGIRLPDSLPEYLLFENMQKTGGCAPFELLVVSGDNPPGKSESITLEENFLRLAQSVNTFLCHDLKTGYPCPTSILSFRNDKPYFIRRSRGCVPQDFPLISPAGNSIGAFGCDQSAAIALCFEKRLIPSQPLGFLSSKPDAQILNSLMEHFTCLMDRVPEVVVCDMDRTSFSAQTAAEFADLHHLPIVTIQTHHAQALACMAEHQLTKALALVLNNGSKGPDGTIWGSEAFSVRLDGFSRCASYTPFKRSKAQPERYLLERLMLAGKTPSAEFLKRLHVSPEEAASWRENRLGDSPHAVYTCSAGELGETVCAGLGLTDQRDNPEHYRFVTQKYAARYGTGSIPEELREFFAFRTTEDDDFLMIDWTPLILHIAELPALSEEEKPLYAAGLQDAIARAGLVMLKHTQKIAGLNDVVLSGSFFLDPTLALRTQILLRENGFQVYLHEKTASDESSVCIGQAYAAAFT